MHLPRVRRRSVAFLDRDGERWACFLVSFRGEDGRWRGYFSFRPGTGDLEEDEIRTADIFLEDSEDAVQEKARGLGRPLLSNLLASSLHAARGTARGPERLRRWFRRVLSEDSRALVRELEAGVDPGGGNGSDPDALGELRSLYASYRLDQVAHLIALVDPDDFRDAVETLLAGESIDFRSRDRLQLAMLVVERIEALLPLPPFPVWVEDYLAGPDRYRLYAHALHREEALP